ncbi:histamine H2 receptor-like [Actinia tenebrosa]|uniref:Histamine H2 receptor-like n=1 Tax=Actinia tenebrosa TaxID=6105 RepID=A0A6P8HJ36_ACTTE|nr:histamine H2 receptor-like [Actinia tenebrosa]
MNNSNSPISYRNVSRKSAIIMFSVSIVVSFLVVASNLATILTFLVNRHLRRRSVYCLIHLAVVDMMHGVLRMAFESCVYDFYFGSKLFCSVFSLNIVLAIHDLTFAMCLFSLVLISLERTYATFSPFKYRTLRLKSYIMLCTSAWLLSALIIGPFIKTKTLPNYGSIFITILITISFICLIVMCTSYKAILHNIKLQSKRLNTSQHKTSITRRPNCEQHLAVTLVIVTLLFVITWLPWIVTVTIVLCCTKEISFIEYRVILIIQLTNSLINPIVYVTRMRDFREAMAKLIFRCSLDLHRPREVVQYHKNGRGNEAVVQLSFR